MGVIGIDKLVGGDGKLKIEKHENSVCCCCDVAVIVFGEVVHRRWPPHKQVAIGTVTCTSARPHCVNLGSGKHRGRLLPQIKHT